MIKRVIIIGMVWLGLVCSGEGRAQGVVVTGRGYPPKREDISEVRRRLLARRAAVLDAYRKLALATSGVSLPKDGSVYTSAFIKGAKVKNVRYYPDGMVEVVMVLE